MLSDDTISLRHLPRRSSKNCDLPFAKNDIFKANYSIDELVYLSCHTVMRLLSKNVSWEFPNQHASLPMAEASHFKQCTHNPFCRLRGQHTDQLPLHTGFKGTRKEEGPMGTSQWHADTVRGPSQVVPVNIDILYS